MRSLWNAGGDWLAGGVFHLVKSPDVLVAQDCGGSSGADQLRGVRGQHGHLGTGDHGLLDSTLDEHPGRRPAQCGLGMRVEHSRVEGGVNADDQVADAVVHQAAGHLRPADRRLTARVSAPIVSPASARAC